MDLGAMVGNDMNPRQHTIRVRNQANRFSSTPITICNKNNNKKNVMKDLKS